MNTCRTYIIAFLIPFMVLMSGCMTYYKRSAALTEAYIDGNYSKANALLKNKKWKTQKRNHLLYYLNKGTVLHMMGEYEQSNVYFQKADYYIEDYRKNYGLKALSYLTNPSVDKYAGENYEKILLHYYSALNYLKLNDLDEALVECKRMLLIMENISNYIRKDTKFHQDAFVHALTGLVYDAQKDYNNAFIAYRNAYELYDSVYAPQLSVQAPMQLKKDLLRSAYLSGFNSDVMFYEKKFGFSFDKKSITQNKNSVVCFWNNGLCPEKQQTNISFVISNMGNGYAMFSNLELGIRFPFYVGNNNAKMNSLTAMKFMRVSYPKYVSWPLMAGSLQITKDTAAYGFDLAEDINLIAKKTLLDRMSKEITSMLFRLAVKKISEAEMNKNNPGLGMVMNVVNTLTENADTRQWQLLPAEINYRRVPLKEGVNELLISNITSEKVVDTIRITTTDYPRTYFHSVTTY